MDTGLKFGMGVLALSIGVVAFVYGILYFVTGGRPTSSDEPCTGIECVQPVMIDPDMLPDTGTSYTVKAPPALAFASTGKVSFDELTFASMGRILFTISPVQDGKFTVTLGPDYTWDEAGEEFWRLMEKFAAPNALIWKAEP